MQKKITQVTQRNFINRTEKVHELNEIWTLYGVAS